MRILSNEYPSNLPGAHKKAHGGPARFAADFSLFLLQRGDTWIGILNTQEEIGVPYRECGSRENARYFETHVQKVTLEGLRNVTEPLKPFEYLKHEIETISDFILEIKPDILFLNGFSSFSWLLYAAAKKCSIPIVIQHAGIMKKEVEQYHDMFTKAGSEMCYEMEKDTALGVDVNIFLNTYSKEAFTQSHSITSVPHSIIIPLPHAGWPFNPIKKRNGNKKEVVLGMVARWDRIKNHSAVLALAEEIHKRSLPWKIRTVTTIPPTNIHKKMKKRYRELIEVIPPMGREELRTFYNGLDIALLPSHFDVSPTVVMEALAMGIPTLISPSVGWVSEYTSNGMKDWIISFDDPKKVIDHLEKQLTRKTWNELKKLAKFIELCHNRDTLYKTYVHIFEGLSILK